VSTPHDVKVKLMVANQLGFTTMGSNVLKSEIPVGWHTGKHRHGEESMHILDGEGFSIINGQRFNWHKSSTLQIPFWAEHQHFNTGNEPVLILHGMTFDLERFVRIARIEQLETCGPNDPAVLAAMPEETRNTIPMERARSFTSSRRRRTRKTTRRRKLQSTRRHRRPRTSDFHLVAEERLRHQRGDHKPVD
jgi:gentisate 1,2-dioxygenase